AAVAALVLIAPLASPAITSSPRALAARLASRLQPASVLRHGPIAALPWTDHNSAADRSQPPAVRPRTVARGWHLPTPSRLSLIIDCYSVRSGLLSAGYCQH